MVLPSTDKETHSKENSIISSGNRGNNRQNHNLTLSLVPKKSLFFFQLQGLCNLRIHCMIIDLFIGRASGFYFFLDLKQNKNSNRMKKNCHLAFPNIRIAKGEVMVRVL